MKKVTFTKVTGDILRVENLLNSEIGGFDIITKTVNNAGNENKRNYKI
jgi:hypothetical protein